MKAKWNQKSLTRKNGQGLVEYIILVVFIAVVSIAVVTLFGKEIKVWFGKATGQISGTPGDLEHVQNSDVKTEVDKTAKDLK